jgi:hypothetical protein
MCHLKFNKLTENKNSKQQQKNEKFLIFKKRVILIKASV